MLKAIRACACCGYLTITEEYDICQVCFWEADNVQEADPTFRGGANPMNLAEARASFRSIGAIGAEWQSFVRAPRPHEHPR